MLRSKPCEIKANSMAKKKKKDQNCQLHLGAYKFLRACFQFNNPGERRDDRGEPWSPTGPSLPSRNFPTSVNNGSFLLIGEENPRMVADFSHLLSVTPVNARIDSPSACPVHKRLPAPSHLQPFTHSVPSLRVPTTHLLRSQLFLSLVSGFRYQGFHEALPDHTPRHICSVGWMSLLWAPIRSLPPPRCPPALTSRLTGCVPC